MISRITLLIILTSLVSCGKSVTDIQSDDGLSEQEREYLRGRATSKCLEQTESSFKILEKTSNHNMLGSKRNKTWKLESKKNNSVNETSYLYVWKVSPPYVYYRLSLKDEEGNPTNKFLKLDTTTNIEMLRNLQKSACAKKLELNVGSSLSARILDSRVRVDNETQVENEMIYRIHSDYPAYFGAINRTKKKKTLDNNGAAKNPVEVYDNVISKNADADQPASYKDSTISNRKYCMVKYSAPVAPEKMNVYSFPFSLACSSDDENGPDVSGDSIPDFDPIAEL